MAAAPPRMSAPTDIAPDISEKVESGWTAVAKSIREVDEQKIKDYKEDIDTILVFAGLYSAVLSALLVESVQSLQPDPSTIAVLLLSQLVAQTQSYTIDSGFLNSTVAPLNVNTVINGFQPTLAAKRVNVLWFASLTLALISASFGILVKQWLREYLAGEYISPQARLRVRHFRTPGLEDWHVFTIAALLPLLLQLALALFFVGLCFFTLDIHNSIGYTTIPLVGGWALLFVAASFAPALSPRCPYKTPLFKSIMQLLRNGLFHVISLLNGFPRLPKKTEWVVTREWTWKFLWYNEEDAAKNARHDVDILVDVDKSQTDDQLVMKMCSALQEVHTQPEDVVDFVLKTIGFRLGTSVAVRPLPLMLDLLQLPVRTGTILMDTVAETLRREVARYPPSAPIKWTPWMVDCFALLVAKLPCQLSDKAGSVVTLCFTYTQYSRVEATVGTLITLVSPDKRLDLSLHLFQRLRNALRNLDASQFFGTAFLIIRQCYCEHDNLHRCQSLYAIDRAHSLQALQWDSLCELYSDFLLRQLAIGVPWDEWHRAMLRIALGRYVNSRQSTPRAILPWHDGFIALGQRLAINRKECPALYRYLYDPLSYYEPAIYAFSDIYSNSAEKHQILKTLHASYADYVNLQMAQSQASGSSAFVLHVLKFFKGQRETMKITVFSGTRRTAQQDLVPFWQQIWEVSHRALCSVGHQFRTEEHSEWATDCLSVIDSIDDLWLPLGPVPGVDPDSDEHFDLWAQTFPVHASFFSDHVVETLMTVVPSFEGVAPKRVRRIRWLRERSVGPRPAIAERRPVAVPIMFPSPPRTLPFLPSASHLLPPVSPSPFPPPPPPPLPPLPISPEVSSRHLHERQIARSDLEPGNNTNHPNTTIASLGVNNYNKAQKNGDSNGPPHPESARSTFETQTADADDKKEDNHSHGVYTGNNTKPASNVTQSLQRSSAGSLIEGLKDNDGFGELDGTPDNVRADGDNNREDQSHYGADNGHGSGSHARPDASTPTA